MFWNVTQALMSGLWTTFEIFILTLIFSLPLGLIFAFGLLSRFKPIGGCHECLEQLSQTHLLCYYFYHYILRTGLVASSGYMEW